LSAPLYAPLDGERVRLRPYRRDDVAAIRRWVNSEFEVLDGMAWWTQPQTEEETVRHVESRLLPRPGVLDLVICLREDPQETYIGGCGLLNIDRRHRRAEAGIVIGSPEHIGRGLGTEAMVLLLRFGFDFINLQRIGLQHYEYNRRAGACYRKLGFVEEGRMRRLHYWRGRYWDAIVMSILREEFYRRWGPSPPPVQAGGSSGATLPEEGPLSGSPPGASG